MIKITEKAEKFLQKNLEIEENKNLIIYIYVTYPLTQHAHVNITYCKEQDLNSEDYKINLENIKIYIEKKSIDLLKNSIIDFKNDNLFINAPNINKKTIKNIKEKIKYLFENEINVMLSQHGGFIQLIDIINDDTLIIKFHGGCQGCGMVGYTLNNYIEKIIKKNFPQIKNINDTTQHEIKDQSYY